MIPFAFFGVVMALLWISAIVDAIRAPGCPQRKPSVKVLWVVGILVTGPVGALVYAAAGRPGSWLRGVVLGVCIMGLAITVPKLYRMSAIKGWIPGATTHIYRVTQKTVHQSDYGDVHWIGWTSRDVDEPGNHRINVGADQWARLQNGDPIEILTVGNDPTPELRDGVYTEPGNFAFDVVLLLLEIAGIVLVTRSFRRVKSAPVALVEPGP
jgi:hypothetical protein